MFAYHLINMEDGPPRVPIIIELRGRSPRSMTAQDILGIWANQNGVTAESLERLNEAGKLLLILEGFDEMDLVGDAARRIEHFLALWRLCAPNSKLLITGRPNFFLDDRERDRALRIDRSSSGRPYCEPVYLMPFNLRQIGQAIRGVGSKTREEICSLAERDEKFRDVVARPSLLFIVGLIWTSDRLSERRGQINSAVVMELFIRRSYARQEDKSEGTPQFMILTGPERSYFMQGVAAYMAANNLPNQITAEQLDEAVELLCDVIPEEVSTGPPPYPALAEPLNRRTAAVTHGMDSVKTDIRSCGLLVVDLSKTGAFRFAHKSFMEYLTAEVLAGVASDRIPQVAVDDAHERGVAVRIAWATKLDLAHLGLYPESLAFFAELFLLRTNISNRNKLLSYDSEYINKNIMNNLTIIFLKTGFTLSILEFSWITLTLLLPRRNLEIGLPTRADLKNPTVRMIVRSQLLFPCCQALGIPEEVFDARFRRSPRFLMFLKSAPLRLPNSESTDASAQAAQEGT
jgi:hypothetical protein